MIKKILNYIAPRIIRFGAWLVEKVNAKEITEWEKVING